MSKKMQYQKPILKRHGNIKEITKGYYEGGSDAITGDDVPAPSG